MHIESNVTMETNT